jgi:hypothetical protein
VEQSTDLFEGRDYTWLAALVTRPTLLVYNAKTTAASGRYGEARRVRCHPADIRLYGKMDDFGWHENRDLELTTTSWITAWRHTNFQPPL